MVKGRGQKASEQPRSINEALSELRGLVRERPVPLQRIATLIRQHDSGGVMLSYADEALGDDLATRQLQAMELSMKRTPLSFYKWGFILEDDQPHLSNHDLSRLDVTNLDLTGFDFRNTSPKSKLDLSGIIVREDWTNAYGHEVALEARFLWDGTRLVRAVFFDSEVIETVFEDCDMREVNLEEVTCHASRFTRCNLLDAYGQRSELSVCDFDDCNLDGAVLSYCDLGENRYWKCSMRRADFARSDCSRSTFAGCDMSRANFANAVLAEAWMHECDLTGANLSEATLLVADLSEAVLTEARLLRADLRQASLKRAILTGANLTGANLAGARLYKADLSGANLTETELSGANLRGADLSGADLSGANLTEANLSDTDLRAVVYDQRTIWPEDFEMSRLR